jgi:hypothetical protein
MLGQLESRVRQRGTNPIDPLADAAVGPPNRSDRGKAAAQVDLDFDEAGVDADEDRPRGSSEHRIVLAEEAWDRGRRGG